MRVREGWTRLMRSDRDKFVFFVFIVKLSLVDDGLHAFLLFFIDYNSLFSILVV